MLIVLPNMSNQIFTFYFIGESNKLYIFGFLRAKNNYRHKFSSIFMFLFAMNGGNESYDEKHT